MALISLWGITGEASLLETVSLFVCRLLNRSNSFPLTARRHNLSRFLKRRTLMTVSPVCPTKKAPAFCTIWNRSLEDQVSKYFCQFSVLAWDKVEGKKGSEPKIYFYSARINANSFLLCFPIWCLHFNYSFIKGCGQWSDYNTCEWFISIFQLWCFFMFYWLAEVFEPFLRSYLETYQYQTVTTSEWKSYLEGYFHDKVGDLTKLS